MPTLRTSFRRTRSSTALILKYYAQGMKTTSVVENDLKLLQFETLESIKLIADQNESSVLSVPPGKQRICITHCPVAISNHTISFNTYLTPFKNDTISIQRANA